MSLIFSKATNTYFGTNSTKYISMAVMNKYIQYLNFRVAISLTARTARASRLTQVGIEIDRKFESQGCCFLLWIHFELIHKFDIICEGKKEVYYVA
jgi:hypothetical protein